MEKGRLVTTVTKKRYLFTMKRADVPVNCPDQTVSISIGKVRTKSKSHITTVKLVGPTRYKTDHNKHTVRPNSGVSSDQSGQRVFNIPKNMSIARENRAYVIMYCDDEESDMLSE